MDEGLHDVGSAMLEKEGAEFLFVIDRDATKLQEGIPEELNLQYREALSQMIEGNWDICQDILITILRTIWPGDGPSEAMYRFMAEYSFKCPPNWNGYRALDAETLANSSREAVDLDDADSPSSLHAELDDTISPRTGRSGRNARVGSRAESGEDKKQVSFSRRSMGFMLAGYLAESEQENIVMGDMEEVWHWRNGDWR
jgi:hypothetical protein